MHGLEKEYWNRVDFLYIDIDDPANDPTLREFGFWSQPEFFLLDAEGNQIEHFFGMMATQLLPEALDRVAR